MSKKQKRQVSQARTAPAVATGAVETPRPAVRASRMPSAEDFNPDYSHVISDLKRIGILAVSFIALLVVLSFIIK